MTKVIGNLTKGAADGLYIPKSVVTAANDFIVATGNGAVTNKTLAQTRTLLTIPWAKDVPMSNTGSITSTPVWLMGSQFTATTGLELEADMIPLGVYVSVGNVSAESAATVKVEGTWWMTNQSAGSEICTAVSPVLDATSKGFDWKSTTILNSIGTIVVGTKLLFSFKMNTGTSCTLTGVHVRLVGKLA